MIGIRWKGPHLLPRGAEGPTQSLARATSRRWRCLLSSGCPSVEAERTHDLHLAATVASHSRLQVCFFAVPLRTSEPVAPAALSFIAHQVCDPKERYLLFPTAERERLGCTDGAPGERLSSNPRAVASAVSNASVGHDCAARKFETFLIRGQKSAPEIDKVMYIL